MTTIQHMTGEQTVRTVDRSTTTRARAPRARGFTLIELMIAVAVVAILAAIAIPSYQDSVRKGRRGQAKSDLVELAQRAERFRTVNSTYAGFWATVAANNRVSPRDGGTAYYTITETEAATALLLTATPGNGQEKDTRCGVLSLSGAGVKTESGTATRLSECW